MSDHLPEDVVVNILSRLPPKSLIRFKCVSKTWHALIGNPDFLSKNLLNHSILPQNAGDPHRFILFYALDISDYEKQIHSFRSYDSLHCLHCAAQTPLNLSPALHFVVLASCNGLLCIWNHRDSDFFLWNPATSSEPEALPAGSFPPNFGSTGELVGFGFDSGSNDFKVVRVLDEDKIGWCQAEIYSLRCDSWRLLDPSPFVVVDLLWRWAALDGVFLWYADDACLGDVSETIIAFDFSDEEFRTIQFPDSRFFCDYGEYTRTLTELNGSVAMVVFPPRKNKNKNKKEMYLDIWVMLEFGVRESWTRLLSIGLPLHLERPLRFWKNGELFMERSEGQLVLYDVFTQTETNLQFEGDAGTLGVF